MVMEEWVNVISTVGFPIAITGWFMFRMEVLIKNNTEALIQVKDIMVTCDHRKK